MVQRLFADIITWRDLVYEYSWAKSPMISGYANLYYISMCPETGDAQNSIYNIKKERERK